MLTVKPGKRKRNRTVRRAAGHRPGPKRSKAGGKLLYRRRKAGKAKRRLKLKRTTAPFAAIRGKKRGQRTGAGRRRAAAALVPAETAAAAGSAAEDTSGTQQEKDEALAGESGVNLVGLIYYEMGIGESCRLAARAISKTDVPFGMIHYPLNTVSRDMDLSWAHKEISDPIYNTNIIHLNADTLRNAHQHFGDRLFRSRYNIGFWHWELPDFPEEFTDGFRFVDEIWVPSAFVLDSVSRKAKLPVVRIPHGVEVEYNPGISRDTFGLPHNRFLFLSMFDTLSYVRRKNPEGAILAFKQAFDRSDASVGLVVKLNNAGARPGDLEYVRQLIDGYDNIYVLDQTVTRTEVNSLIQCTDCYVSLHRAEGFGLGLAEAMYLGKPALATNWSGNTDFMNPMNSCLVHYKLSRVGEDWGPYKAYQTWAEPDIAHAAAWMKHLVQLPEWRQAVALQGQETIRTHFSPQVVGNMTKQRLQRLELIR